MKGKIHSSKAESIYRFYLLWGGQGIPRGIQSEWAVVECVGSAAVEWVVAAVLLPSWLPEARAAALWQWWLSSCR